jgi:hypothetical protein
MAVEVTESGTLITDDSTIVASCLSNWYAGRLALKGIPTRNNTYRFQVMKAQCGSTKRTHAGVLVDYTIWLASYGIEPSGTLSLEGLLNPTNAARLKRGLATARAEAAKRKAAAE